MYFPFKVGTIQFETWIPEKICAWTTVKFSSETGFLRYCHSCAQSQIRSNVSIIKPRLDVMAFIIIIIANVVRQKALNLIYSNEKTNIIWLEEDATKIVSGIPDRFSSNYSTLIYLINIRSKKVQRNWMKRSWKRKNGGALCKQTKMGFVISRFLYLSNESTLEKFLCFCFFFFQGWLYALDNVDAWQTRRTLPLFLRLLLLNFSLLFFTLFCVPLRKSEKVS